MILPITSPWLFIYLRHDCRAVPLNNSDTVMIIQKGLCVAKLPRSATDSFNKHYFALLPGYKWSGLIWPNHTNQCALFFSVANRAELPEVILPEDFIARIYNMSAREYIYHHLSPNPPH